MMFRIKQVLIFLFFFLNQGSNQKDFGLVDQMIDNGINDEKTHVDGETQRSNESGIACQSSKTDFPDGFGISNDVDKGSSISNGTSVPSESTLLDSIEPRGSKRLLETEEPDTENKRSRTVVIDSDDDSQAKDAIFSTVKVEDQSDLKENAVEADSIPSKNLNEKFHCTACNKIAVEVHQHPLLKVIICADCKAIMEEKMNGKVRIFNSNPR